MRVIRSPYLLCFVALRYERGAIGFQPKPPVVRHRNCLDRTECICDDFIVSESRRTKQLLFLSMEPEKEAAEGKSDLEYRNVITSVLSNFMQKSTTDTDDDDTKLAKLNPLDAINWDAPKIQPRPSLETLAAMLDAELYEKEWFVTGNVNPIYFSDDFEFQDPDVQLSGIEEYASGVFRLFDQETSRAEIISTKVNDTVADTITVTWRLSGKVNIGPGINIKPYICYSDLVVKDGLIVSQEDRFDIPGWDILLSGLFPFVVGRVTAPAAPPVEPRPVPQMPKTDRFSGESFLSDLSSFFKGR